MVRKSRKAVGISVDFSETETNLTIEEGPYLLEVEDVEVKTSENSGADYLAFTFKVVDGKFKGKKVWHNCSLQPQALFNLRGLLEALGYEVPQGPMELDPADLIGEQCGAEVVHEVYQGKKKARVAEFFSPAELGEEEEEELDEEEAEEAPAPKKGKKQPEPEEDGEDEEDEAPEPKGKKAPAKRSKGKKAKTIQVGSTVTFEDDDGATLEGTVTFIDGDDVTVDVDDEEWELELSDLTLVE